MSAEYAGRAHVTVLARDRKRLWAAMGNASMGIRSEQFRLALTLATAVTCPRLFCTSTNQCIEGKINQFLKIRGFSFVSVSILQVLSVITNINLQEDIKLTRGKPPNFYHHLAFRITYRKIEQRYTLEWQKEKRRKSSRDSS
jgi:hypothetical protein